MNHGYYPLYMVLPIKITEALFWDVVEKVGDSFKGGWLYIGDFNHVFTEVDK